MRLTIDVVKVVESRNVIKIVIDTHARERALDAVIPAIDIEISDIEVNVFIHQKLA